MNDNVGHQAELQFGQPNNNHHKTRVSWTRLSNQKVLRAVSLATGLSRVPQTGTRRSEARVARSWRRSVKISRASAHGHLKEQIRCQSMRMNPSLVPRHQSGPIVTSSKPQKSKLTTSSTSGDYKRETKVSSSLAISEFARFAQTSEIS